MIQMLTVISAYSAILRLTGSSICCVAIILPQILHKSVTVQYHHSHGP